MASTKESLEYGFKTLELAKEICDDMKIITVMLTISSSYYCLADIEKALEYAHTALQKSIEIDNSFQISTSHYTLSMIEPNKKNAIDHALKTKEICEINGDTDLLTAVYYSLGRIYYSIQKVDEAIENLLKSLNLTKRPSQKGILYLGIGEIYIEMKDFEQAFDYVTGALRLFKKLNYVPGLISCYNFLGYIYIEKKKYTKAINSANSSLKIAEESNTDTSEFSSESYNILAKVARIEKDYEKAKEYFDILLKMEDYILAYKDPRKIFYDNYIEYLKEIGDTAECEKYEKKLKEMYEGNE